MNKDRQERVSGREGLPAVLDYWATETTTGALTVRPLYYWLQEVSEGTRRATDAVWKLRWKLAKKYEQLQVLAATSPAEPGPLIDLTTHSEQAALKQRITALDRTINRRTVTPSLSAWYEEADYVRIPVDRDGTPRGTAKGFTWQVQQGKSHDRRLIDQATGEAMTEHTAQRLSFGLLWQSAMVRMGVLPACLDTVPVATKLYPRQRPFSEHDAFMPPRTIMKKRTDYYNAESEEIDRASSPNAMRPPPGFGFEQKLLPYQAVNGWNTTADWDHDALVRKWWKNESEL